MRGCRLVVVPVPRARSAACRRRRASWRSPRMTTGPAWPRCSARAKWARRTLSGTAAASVGRELDERLAQTERRVADRSRKIEEVRAALGPGGIVPVFQPIMDLVTRRVVGYEALARLQVEPKRPPDQWFAAAVEVGQGRVAD